MDSPNNQRKVKIVWFFRPSEVQKWLRERKVAFLVHEIFLASGEGIGVANINPVEAIVGKCYVVCTSKDIRNPQPSKEERRKAEFVFSRAFDVIECTFLDKLNNIISGIKVEHFFNSKECSALSGDQEQKEVENPKSSGSEKDDLQAPIVLGGEDTKLKSQGVLYHSGSLRSTSFEETVKLGGSTKPKMRCKYVGALSGFHASHDRTIDRGISSNECLRKRAKLAGKEAASKPAGEKGTKDERVILSKRPTKFEDRGAAPELAQEEGRNTDAQYLSIKEREKDSARNDRRLSSATTTEKKLDLSERSEGAIDLVGQRNWLSSTLNRNDKETLLSNKEASEAPQQKKMIKSDCHTAEAQKIDKTKWFKEFTWKDKMDCARTKGTLVLLQNLDPSYSAAEIEEIILTYLKVRCTAKVSQQSKFTGSHNGQALLIFQTEEKAAMVIKQLRDRCLMLPNGRPLIAQREAPRVLPKSAKYYGNLTVDRIKHREQKDAVSTSHCAQPNTIEYELSLDWILYQKRSEASRQTLFEGHGKELAALKAQLKQY
ncbi:protein ANTI-SILENCING 1-like isoform X2 [Papaver somniferum]|nr:protein ANTI-SILENCING 1-like isoform X2 [Papaver somniferum]